MRRASKTIGTNTFSLLLSNVLCTVKYAGLGAENAPSKNVVRHGGHVDIIASGLASSLFQVRVDLRRVMRCSQRGS